MNPPPPLPPNPRPPPPVPTINRHEKPYIYSREIDQDVFREFFRYNSFSSKGKTDTSNIQTFVDNVPLNSVVQISKSYLPKYNNENQTWKNSYSVFISNKYWFVDMTIEMFNELMTHFKEIVDLDNQSMPSSLGGKKTRRSRRHKHRKNKKRISRKYKK
jgi:hypothetical protein